MQHSNSEWPRCDRRGLECFEVEREWR